MSMTDPSTQSPATHPADPCCPVVEVRQYTLYPGQRDVLITLFDRALVDSQEACGMRIIGQFRDRDRPNRFVWLRGFGDMSSRGQALQRFYSGPVWAAHRDEANATMVDFSDVLLLRPARPTSGFVLDTQRAAPNAPGIGPGLVMATIYSLATPADADFLAFFEAAVVPVLREAGAEVAASFVTEPSANTFPALPVREGAQVFVWFARFADSTAYERHLAALTHLPRWRTELAAALADRLTGSPEIRKLEPTARSLLHG